MRGSIEERAAVALKQQQTNQLLQVQKDILEVVVTSNQYQEALDKLCIAAEGLLPDSTASIMIFEQPENHLVVRSAPNMPAEAIGQLEGLVPGENAGSCGTAVFKNEAQFVCDTACDNRWQGFAGYIEEFGIRACWSMPVRDPQQKSIGSFALASKTTREPSQFHYLLLETVAKLAAIILTREKEQTRLQIAASYDGLTGLENRASLLERISEGISRCERHSRMLAVLFIDLDNFKKVNDRLGHHVGDSILKAAALEMNKSIRKTDSLARLGGDEFVLVVEEFKDISELRVIAEKMIESVTRATDLMGHASVSASVGVSIYPQDAISVNQLLRCADLAMYRAKDKGKKQTIFFHEP